MNEKIEKINKNLELGDQHFVLSDFTEAAAYYKIALAEAKEIENTDLEFIKKLEIQIKACETPEAGSKNEVAKKELSPAKQNWFSKNFGGGGGFADFGKAAVGSLIKKFIPKIKAAVEKNHPKAIAFMRGELTLKFDPIPAGEKPERRIVIIELNPDANGDVSKDDIIIQIKKAEYVQIMVAKDDAGNDLSKIETFSGMSFIEEILASNLEAAIDEVDFGKM